MDKSRALQPVYDGNVTLSPQEIMARMAHFADQAEAEGSLSDYHTRIAGETLRRHRHDLQCYADYLAEASRGMLRLDPNDLMNDMTLWRNISSGLVAGFRQWMLLHGYSVGTINGRLSTVKKYVELAYKALIVTEDTLVAVRLVKGYKRKEIEKVNAKRDQTRIEGSKKATPTQITDDQARKLKQQEDTRDRLLMCLFIDHGLRCEEVSLLRTENFNLTSDQKTFLVYRPKVSKEGLQELSTDTFEAVKAYLAEYGYTSGFLFKGRTKDTDREGSYGVRAINRRVVAMGEAIGIQKLSPHDLRHYWAWDAARKGISINRLQQAGGWGSLEMPNYYIGRTKIENEGMV